MPPATSIDLPRNAQSRVGRAGGAAIRTIRFRGLPLALSLGYLLTTFIAFLVWPVNWPLSNAEEWWRLSVYVGLCFGLLAAGYWLGSAGKARHGRLPYRRDLYYLGAALSVLLLAPLTALETGRSILELPAALADQTQAYAMFQSQMTLGAASNPLISLLSACAGPFMFVVTPLAVLHWRSMGWIARLTGVVSALSSLSLSVMRGTDREVVNLVIVVGAALLVLLVRESRTSVRAISKLVRRYVGPAVMVLVLAGVGATVMTARKEGRLGGVAAVCVAGTQVCADLQSPALSWMGDRVRFGASVFALSAAQGYYGLDLGLQQDFRSTFGIGHSPAVAAFYTKVTGRTDLQTDAYTYRISSEGWSDQNQWSTMMIWIANDIGFTGAALFVGLMGLIWGKAWRDATAGRDDRAAIMFCLLTILIVYLPINNQLFLTLDSYFSFVFWLVCWLLLGRRAPVAWASAPR